MKNERKKHNGKNNRINLCICFIYRLQISKFKELKWQKRKSGKRIRRKGWRWQSTKCNANNNLPWILAPWFRFSAADPKKVWQKREAFFACFNLVRFFADFCSKTDASHCLVPWSIVIFLHWVSLDAVSAYSRSAMTKAHHIFWFNLALKYPAFVDQKGF